MAPRTNAVKRYFPTQTQTLKKAYGRLALAIGAKKKTSQKMSRIGLIDVDGGKNFPNLALMKISAYHKSIGDKVDWYYPFDTRYDKVYMSKVFSFTPDYEECINADEVVRGGQATPSAL